MNPIRVLVVDDSAFIRHTVARRLDSDPELVVVGSACDGLDALDKIPSLRPDVITLDVEMPRMDGLTALQRIMAECPTPVVMLSSLTQRGARATIKALIGGAVDFVTKPAEATGIQAVTEELIAKVKLAAGASRIPSRSLPDPVPWLRDGAGSGRAGVEETTPPRGVAGPRVAEPRRAWRDVPASPGDGLHPFQNGDPLIVIGASTGGPRALQEVLRHLPGNLPAAVVVVQHMPPGFTRSLAQRLDEVCSLTVSEASDGDRLARGLVLLAPGDYHLRLRGARQVALDQGPRQHHVRPSVDVAMESAAEHHGAAAIGVVLTGMGSDGTTGAGCIKAAGGRIIAEHEATSVVYGMPRSVVEAGLADRIAPLPEVATILLEWVNHGPTGV